MRDLKGFEQSLNDQSVSYKSIKLAISVKSNCYLREKTKKNSQIVQTGHRESQHEPF